MLPLFNGKQDSSERMADDLGSESHDDSAFSTLRQTAPTAARVQAA
jgi:hypothetical protein